MRQADGTSSVLTLRVGGAALGLIASCVLIALTMQISAARAEAVHVAGAQPRREIVVRVEDASVGEILRRLAEQYGFEVKGIERVGSAPPMSVEMTGSLETVLGRLLRNRNYMVVRSADNASGIERVLILDGTYGAAPSGFTGPPPQGEDLIQALSGTP